MCGIVGYAGYRKALPILIDCLKRLEYRGYDSAGVAVVQDGVRIAKDKGYIANLESTMPDLGGVTGTYAICVVCADEPEKVVAARNFSPLVVGLGADENYVASDVPALLKHTDRVLYVMDREVVVLTPKSVRILDLEGQTVEREPQRISWTIEDAERGGFEHFMLKEIHEQPQAIHSTLLGRMTEVESNGFFRNGFTSVKLVACGTSYHAALVGKYILEEVARVPATVELASEYRYGPSPAERPLVILISQSGETADTMGAAREAKRRGCRTLGITNVVGSSLTRETERTMYTRAGLEIGVAATKTFTAQLVALYLVAIRMGLERGTLDPEDANRFRDELRALPRHVQSALNQTEAVE